MISALGQVLGTVRLAPLRTTTDSESAYPLTDAAVWTTTTGTSSSAATCLARSVTVPEPTESSSDAPRAASRAAAIVASSRTGPWSPPAAVTVRVGVPVGSSPRTAAWTSPLR
jgi:hypothetical protein